MPKQLALKSGFAPKCTRTNDSFTCCRLSFRSSPCTMDAGPLGTFIAIHTTKSTNKGWRQGSLYAQGIAEFCSCQWLYFAQDRGSNKTAVWECFEILYQVGSVFCKHWHLITGAKHLLCPVLRHNLQAQAVPDESRSCLSRCTDSI